MGERGQIKFQPIPCVEGAGHIALTVYPPGTFINNKHYSVFVGGCGIGERKTEAAAEAYLLEAALKECDRRIAEAEKQRDHYTWQRQLLDQRGLKRTTKEKP